MKPYIHARLTKDDQAILQMLKKTTGETESELVRRGLRLMARDLDGGRSALSVAGDAVGKFEGGPKDLSMNRKHLERFGR